MKTLTKQDAEFLGSNLDYDDIELGPSNDDIKIDFDAIIAEMLKGKEIK